MNQQQPPNSQRKIDSRRDYVEQVQGDVYSGEVHIHQAAQSVPERPTVFHNLPQPDYGHFIGREPELSQLHKLLAPLNRHFVITIDGIGGIGKSALALEVAHAYLRRFEELPEDERFEAIIWTSAKQNVLTAEGILARRQVLHGLQDIYSAIAVALQREDITRAAAEEQDAVVTRALTQQRTLLIVDNLETVDDEAVLAFLRELPAPTKAIVTTRHRIDVAYPIRLSGLPWKDARDLIAQECEEKCVILDKDLTRRLYERTGGVPLALVWCVSQMGFGYSPQAVLTRLGQPNNDITKFCFEGAVQRIKNNPAYTLLLALSLCADSASRDTLGYATELPELDRDDGLVLLEKLSLVNKQGDRFWLLPLTKGYAAAELEKYPERERLWEKWVEYFRDLCEEYSGDYRNWMNYDWLSAEGENILSIIDRVVQTGDDTTVLHFRHAVQRYLYREERWDRWSTYGKQFYGIALAANDKKIVAWICLRWLIPLHATQGRIKQAEVYAKQSVELYKELQDTKGQCLALNGLGRVLRFSGRYEEAAKVLVDSQYLAQEHQYFEGMISSRFALGKLARDQQQWQQSKSHWEAVIDLIEQQENYSKFDSSSLRAAYGQLGWIEYQLGNYQRAKELVEKTLSYFDNYRGKGTTVALRIRLAAIEHALGEDDIALQHAKDALFWAERFGMKWELREVQVLLQKLKAETSGSYDKSEQRDQ